MENHIFLISCGVAALYRLYNPLSHHVTQWSRLSQGLSHLWTLSHTTPMDVCRVRIKEAKTYTPWVVVIGQQADAYIPILGFKAVIQKDLL